MLRKNLYSQGRRDFLKMGTIVSIGSLVTDSSMMTAMAQMKSFVPKSILRPDLYCDIYRSQDMMFLRLYFFNARMVGDAHMKRKTDQHPLFMYVKLPSQHVGEELVDNPSLPLTGKASFAADNSWLAFKLQDQLDGTDISINRLLDWNGRFDLITLNNFGSDDRSGLINRMDDALKWLIPEFAEQKIVDEHSAHQNRVNNAPVYWPITKFSIPYKMYLSPIGAPDAKSGAPDWSRQAGDFFFLLNNNPRHEYNSSAAKIRITRPWTNQLAFRTPEGEVLPPRMKVVHYSCPRPEDHDDKLDLLPAPIHRYELQGLTMQPDFDRDVLTDFLRISAYGASTHLYYRNSFPQKFATVAWEQRIYGSRDNYISMTVRAIDYFTSIKLLISIVGERSYKDGISFIPRAYFVAYDEESKDYVDPGTISNLPFTKIVPVRKGAFFFPKNVPTSAGVINNAYAVAPRDMQDGTYDASRLLEFEYLCYDKNGAESRQQYKMIFILAEDYSVYEGSYEYYRNGTLEATYSGTTTNPAPVNIKHIGQLNPARQERFQNNPRSSPCGEIPNLNYWFRLNKTFDAGQRPALEDTLSKLQEHVTSQRQHFTSFRECEITYARLTALKGNADASGQVKNALIKNDSANATFATNSILTVSVINPGLYSGSPLQDSFLHPAPLLTHMNLTTVVVSQIDQMEGKTTYRPAVFARDYCSTNMEIDEPNENNSTKLLFQLVQDIDDFFARNYRSAGAVVNPGIDIRFVSVLDQGITFNDTHNKAKKLEAQQLKKTGELVKVLPHFDTSSIFKPLKAEILGIQLVLILEDVLPVEDLPVFTYVRQAEEAVNKINSLVAEYTAMVSVWKQRYQEAKNLIDKYNTQLRSLESTIRNLAGNKFRSWIEGLIASQEAQVFYKQLRHNLQAYEAGFTGYKNNVIKPVLEGFGFYNEVAPLMKDLADEPNAAKVYALIEKVAEKKILPQQAGEALRMFITLYDETKLQLDALRFAIHALEQDAAMIRSEIYLELRKGAQDALLFIRQHVNEQSEIAQNKVNTAAHNILSDVLASVPAEIFDRSKLNGLLILYELYTIYRQYHQLYKQLQKRHYEELAVQLNLGSYSTADIEALEKELVYSLLEAIRAIPIQHLPEAYKANALKLRDHYVAIITSRPDDALQQFEQITREHLDKHLADALAPYTTIINQVDRAYETATREFNRVKLLYEDREKFVREFIQRMVQETKAELEKEVKELLRHAYGSTAYQDAKEKIDSLQGILRKIQEFSKQKLEYTFSTEKIRSANLGGVITFQPNRSRLDVKVAYEYELDISEYDRLPTIKKQTFFTDSSLTDFKLGFLQILFIDFKKVQFIAGSDIKDDFKVEIRNVEFSGFLSFVKAFQDYLKSIDNNLVFDIDATGARIGYGIRIPDITAGYFNFFNLSLAALLTLPFEPGKSMQLKFGLGSELNKFGLTVSGVFGGQGYFNLIAEPKRGIVGLEMALEFGAIFNLNIGVAWGTAYLVGGVYIKRYGGQMKLKAYILCVGRLDILGIFSASLTFYVGLEGDSHILEGVCVVEAKKRFSRFFTLKVKCSMRKTLKGGKSDTTNNAQNFLKFASLEKLQLAGLKIRDTNLRQGMVYEDEHLYIAVEHDPDVILGARLEKKGGISADKSRKVNLYKSAGKTSSFITIPSINVKTDGEYELYLDANGNSVAIPFTVIKNLAPKCGEITQLPLSETEYYSSFYQF